MNDLKAFLERVKEVPLHDLPQVLGELEVIRATALLRISCPMPSAETRDELVTIERAAERLGIGEDYLYRNAKKMPFTRRMGRKLLFSSSGIDEYIRRTRPK
jgi:excisionase family DNA binding protein